MNAEEEVSVQEVVEDEEYISTTDEEDEEQEEVGRSMPRMFHDFQSVVIVL